MLLLQNYLEKYFNWEFGKYQRFIYLELKKAEHFCFWKKKYLNKHKRKLFKSYIGVSKYSGHYSI